MNRQDAKFAKTDLLGLKPNEVLLGVLGALAVNGFSRN